MGEPVWIRMLMPEYAEQVREWQAELAAARDREQQIRRDYQGHIDALIRKHERELAAARDREKGLRLAVPQLDAAIRGAAENGLYYHTLFDLREARDKVAAALAPETHDEGKP